jgi:hypothetical protein
LDAIDRGLASAAEPVAGLSRDELAGYRRFIRQYVAGMIEAGRIPGIGSAFVPAANSLAAVHRRVASPPRLWALRTRIDRITGENRPKPDRRRAVEYSSLGGTLAAAGRFRFGQTSRRTRTRSAMPIAQFVVNHHGDGRNSRQRGRKELFSFGGRGLVTENLLASMGIVPMRLSRPSAPDAAFRPVHRLDDLVGEATDRLMLGLLALLEESR